MKMARSTTNGTFSISKNFLSFSNVIKGTTIPASEVQPPLPFQVQLGITVVFTAIYAALVIFIISQLVLILHYRHRRLSYQSLFLFTCLLWAVVRTTLFSFYFQDCKTVNNLPMFPRWFLFALPIYLQFLMLTLLTLYLVKLMVKSGRTSFEPEKYKKIPNVIFVVSNVIFLVLNITSSVLCPEQSSTHVLVIVRVVVNESLFILAGILLSLSMRKITKTPNSNFFLEGQGTSVCQATCICLIVVLLYISRAIYNMVAVTVPHDMSTFGFGWVNISDEGEINNHNRIQSNDIKAFTFVSFGVILILWEVLPTTMIIWFFRVRRPQESNMLQGPSVIASNSFDQRSYFFDNPRRYDSDEDIHTVHNKSNYDIPGVLSPSSTVPHAINSMRTTRSYGSIAGLKSGSFNRSSSSYPIPGTTPPMLFTSGQQSGYQRNHLEPVQDQD